MCAYCIEKTTYPQAGMLVYKCLITNELAIESSAGKRLRTEAFKNRSDARSDDRRRGLKTRGILCLGKRLTAYGLVLYTDECELHPYNGGERLFQAIR
jgi:hypothetical protein